MSKAAEAIVIDVSDSFRPHLEDATTAVRELVNRKILFQGKDAVVLFAHGTDGTDNVLANAEGAEGQYMHVTELNKMGPVSYRTLAALNDLATRESATADLLDSLTLAVYAVIQHTGKLKWDKRVLILTDGLSPAVGTEEELATIGEQVRHERGPLFFFRVFSPLSHTRASPLASPSSTTSSSRCTGTTSTPMPPTPTTSPTSPPPPRASARAGCSAPSASNSASA